METRAKVFDMSEREVIDAFSNGIRARWQLHEFATHQPKNNEEFKTTVSKMIAAEEVVRERFPDYNRNKQTGQSG